MVVFPAEGYVLAGHVIKCAGHVPGFEWITWVEGEVRSARSGVRAIDGWYEHQVASGVVHASAANGEGEQVLVEPETVVEHRAQEALFGSGCRVTKAAYSAAAL